MIKKQLPNQTSTPFSILDSYLLSIPWALSSPLSLQMEELTLGS